MFRVRVSCGSHAGWLDDDDPRRRQQILARSNLARALCMYASAAMATDLLTVRIDLDLS